MSTVKRATDKKAPRSTDSARADVPVQAGSVRGELRSIRVDHLQVAPGRLRRDLGDISNLAESIQLSGLNHPITVYQTGPDRYRLIAGERRLRAAMSLGAQHIDAIVRPLSPDDDTLVLELVENLARRDLNPEEEADGFITLVRDRDVEVAEVAHRVGRSPAYVSKRIRVFEDADLRSAVVDGAISVSEAEELVIVGDVAQRHDLLARLRAEDWDRARLRAEIRLLSQPADTRVADVAADSRTDAKWPPGMELDVDDGVDFDAEWNADAPAGLHEVMPRPRDLRMQVVRVTTTLKKSALLQQMTTLAAVLENLRPWQLTAGDDQALSELFLVLEGAGAQRTVNALSETLRRLARSSRERRLHLPTIADAEAAAAQRRGTRGG